VTARLFASILVLSLTCAGCGGKPDAEANPVTLVDVGQGRLVRDGCDQAPDLDFRNQVVAAAPFNAPSAVEHGALVLTVDPGQWRNLGYGMRQQIIAIIDCGDAGPGKYHFNIDVRAPDGSEVMKISSKELMQWRAGGLAMLEQTGLRADAVARDATIPNSSPIDPGASGQ
jgi:hypothetical protein